MDTSLSRTGLILGTPHYMPPEQARGDVHDTDARSDVYALGATLYELLVDVPPFRGKSSTDILLKVLQEDAVPLRRLKPSIDRDLEVIVARCMEKSRRRRYRSAAELADDLDRWLRSDPIQAKPASPVYRFRRRLAKHPRVSSVIAGLILLMGIGSLLWSLQVHSYREETRRLAA